MGALAYSGLLGYDRRRRHIAAQLASVPCFGNGEHSSSHQLLAVEKTPMLCFAPQFIAPQEAPVMERVSDDASQSHSPSSTDRHSRSAGITKSTFLEISCRTAHTWVFGRPKRQAWPLNVVRTHRTVGKRFVVIKDQTVQDGAGSVLLSPKFLQSNELDKLMIARAVHEAMYRSAPCILHSVHDKFEASLRSKTASAEAFFTSVHENGAVLPDRNAVGYRGGGNFGLPAIQATRYAGVDVVYRVAKVAVSARRQHD
ncbi:hypothetical protein FGB62_91g18 [Gracilaria domingensis]|nr:hypothetical protein FGB62_91g18 [Gracilaria domingensis]